VRGRVEWSLKITADEYVRGLRERELLRREVAEFFRGADALLLPSMPCVAPPIESLMAKVNGKEYPFMWFHRPFLSPHNVTGCPAVSLPMGFDREGMPLSLQIVGSEWNEGRILGIASAYEEATPEIRARRPGCTGVGGRELL
jgi:aspartyl-tRNA(Asn)/glutamyl-tRNA(Gln) amidotransferase subunit A